VDVPQVRGDVDLYPSSLERGCRSERALKLAIAEMYVKGISTRRGTQRKQEFTEKILLNHFIQGFTLDNTMRDMQPNTNLKEWKS
jgi:transposase-like protein